MRTQTTVREIVARVADLAALPETYIQLRRLLDDPDTPIGRVAELVSYDPAVTARLLRFANSTMLGLTRPVDTVTKAVNVLGTQLVHDVVLAVSVTGAFAGLSTGSISLSRFWANSVFCGLAARGLAERCGVLDSERLFVEGLLRDIGHLVMYHTVPEKAAEARQQSRASGQPLYLTERKLLGFDFAELGAELMRAWNLPGPLVAVIRNHVDPPAAREHEFEIRLVYLASTLTDHYDTGEPAADWSLDPEALSAWQSVGLAIADLEPLVAAAERGVSEARELFVVMPAAA